jgi:hypothetical protein
MKIRFSKHPPQYFGVLGFNDIDYVSRQMFNCLNSNDTLFKTCKTLFLRLKRPSHVFISFNYFLLRIHFSFFI